MATGRGRRFERGSAALELVLLLPLYMLLLFMVLSLGEYGQVTMQLYQASRIAAWQEDAPTTASTLYTAKAAFAHFRSRVDMKYSIVMFAALDLDGSQGTGLSFIGNDGKELLGAHSFAEDGVHDDPLHDTSTGALYAEACEAADIDEVARIALDGKTDGDDDVPWLRRRYAQISVEYTPWGKFLDPVLFRAMHTVLRGKTYSTQAHKPYASNSVNLNVILRGCDAYPNNFYKWPSPSANNHQLDALGVGQYLSPASSEAPSKP